MPNPAILPAAQSHLVDRLNAYAVPLADPIAKLGPLFEQIGDARYVLIGEATHGTEEFYRLRAEVTKVLIRDHGFAAVAVEGDWPDCGHVTRYVKGDQEVATARSALQAFVRFPAWMWANTAVADFIRWLRDYNLATGAGSRVGFYGLDLYSLYASIEAVIAFLEPLDPVAAERARARYACFDHTYRRARDPQAYAYGARLGIDEACERQAVHQLSDLRKMALSSLSFGRSPDPDDVFFAEQNARVVISAETYYRAMFDDRVSSWNQRDRHMANTLFSLAEHLSKRRRETARIVVWAHNSHVGDARATEAGTYGEWTLGQLVKEAHGRDAVTIGLSTYAGTVTAASHWGGKSETRPVRRALPGSYEDVFHAAGQDAFLLWLRDNTELDRLLGLSRLQRAIGVVYLPESERQSHYLYACLPEQFDAVIHIDRTNALEPLFSEQTVPAGEVPETYPEGI